MQGKQGRDVQYSHLGEGLLDRDRKGRIHFFRLGFYFEIKDDENAERYIEIASAFNNTHKNEPVDFVIPPYVSVDGEDLPVKSIGYCSFNGSAAGIATGNGIRLKSVSIPYTVTSIDAMGFIYYNDRYSDSTSIFIPASVVSIGSSAFFECKDFSIFCEATTKPEGWDNNWNRVNSSNLPVVWGATFDEYLESISA